MSELVNSTQCTAGASSLDCESWAVLHAHHFRVYPECTLSLCPITENVNMNGGLYKKLKKQTKNKWSYDANGPLSQYQVEK